MNDSFSDAALALVGHGSTVHEASSAPVHQHAAELRRRGIFSQVVECFWKVEPSIAGALRGISAARVFIVPVFISEGYFTGEVIPRELGFLEPGRREFGRVRRRGDQTWFYCGPVGSHPGMTAVVQARAREVVAQHPFPVAPQPAEMALIIAGHGTLKNENSRRAIERQVRLIRAIGEFAEVHPAFLEEEPRIADCWRWSRSRNLVLVPFFISDGLHTQEDIPILLGEPGTVVRDRLRRGRPPWRNPTERNGKHLWYSPAVGTEPGLVEVIVDLVREAAGIETGSEHKCS